MCSFFIEYNWYCWFYGYNLLTQIFSYLCLILCTLSILQKKLQVQNLEILFDQLFEWLVTQLHSPVLLESFAGIRDHMSTMARPWMSGDQLIFYVTTLLCIFQFLLNMIGFLNLWKKLQIQMELLIWIQVCWKIFVLLILWVKYAESAILAYSGCCCMSHFYSMWIYL